MGSLGNWECCSGALNPKVVLGEMEGLGGTRLIKTPSSWRELRQEWGGPWWTSGEWQLGGSDLTRQRPWMGGGGGGKGKGPRGSQGVLREDHVFCGVWT